MFKTEQQTSRVRSLQRWLPPWLIVPLPVLPGNVFVFNMAVTRIYMKRFARPKGYVSQLNQERALMPTHDF